MTKDDILKLRKRYLKKTAEMLSSVDKLDMEWISNAPLDVLRLSRHLEEARDTIEALEKDVAKYKAIADAVASAELSTCVVDLDLIKISTLLNDAGYKKKRKEADAS